MKKHASLLLVVLLAVTLLTACATTGSNQDAAPTPEQTDKAAFEGTADEILNQLVSKTIEKKVIADEELKDIACYNKNVDADSCLDILGLTPDELAADVEAAVESKPEGSWFAHSIVVIKAKDGVDAAALADRISKGTNPRPVWLHQERGRRCRLCRPVYRPLRKFSNNL